jgi:hypothetical protein
MYIDDFIWLPDILDKIAIKHHVSQDEPRTSSLMIHTTVLLSQGIGWVKMSIQQADRLTQAGT